ncbi:MAG: DUF2835 family protein [Wenzhouxiangellaceae bacterium]|nr:DUF2835 family protein [Wenzhouxiangellaceae bacterium]
MPTIRFQLAIDAAELMRYYSGRARRVRVRAEDGRIVDFDARHLRTVVDTNGVHGRFEIETDAAGRFAALRRV